MPKQVRNDTGQDMIKAVIFDMDGVIIDSEPIHSYSLELLLKSYGKIPLQNKNELIHVVGFGGDPTYERLIKQYDLKEKIEILRSKRRKIFEDLLKKEKLTPLVGTSGLLKKLHKNKIKTAIASNRLLEHVLIILDKLGVKKYFDVIIARTPSIRLKPLPDIYLKTANDLGIDPKHCIAIEDSQSGVLSAHAAGMKVIAVPNKYTKSQDFSKADKIVKSLKDIHISVIKNM